MICYELMLLNNYSESARGKKIVRLVRRVSGMLLQLTIFELPASVVEAANLNATIYEPENTETGYAEEREVTKRLEKFPPPAFRIVGYDPRSKKKVCIAL